MDILVEGSSCSIPAIGSGTWQTFDVGEDPKVWTQGHEAGEAQMRESFQRMRTERMDLMQVHNLLDAETHLRTLSKWKAEERLLPLAQELDIGALRGRSPNARPCRKRLSAPCGSAGLKCQPRMVSWTCDE